jgi:hydroxypyruvate reductase
MSPTPASEAARAILAAALARVDPLAMLAGQLALDGDTLRIAAAAWDLRGFDRIVAFGAGKASARLGLGLEALLEDRLSGGVIVTKQGHGEALARLRLLEAAHPVPDGSSVRAAEALLALGREAGERTLFLGLTSGGGSALLCAPAPGLTLADKQAATGLLLACGAEIREINAVRRHLSAIKGGRLAAALAPATVVNLLLSDVLGDDPAAIASGITAPDPSTFGEALAVLDRYGLRAAVPASVRRHLEAGRRGEVRETPKPGEPVFGKVRNLILGSNRLAVEAAGAAARGLGYAVHLLPEPVTGEAREAAGRLLEWAARLPAPACLIGGGETTVTLRGPGRGGRNQELALAALALGERDPDRLRGLTLLSAGTDGNDGPTDAAGAFADAGILARARSLGLSPAAFLERNDSYAFFAQAGGHLVTGPTNTNVCDLQIVIVDR